MVKGSSIKGQLVVEDMATNDTIRLALGAPRAKQLATPAAAQAYLQGLAGDERKLTEIKVNDVPIAECHNLSTMRQNGAVLNITAQVAAPPMNVPEPVVAMDTTVDELAAVAPPTTIKLSLSKETSEKEWEKMTGFERMAAVGPEKWLY